MRLVRSILIVVAGAVVNGCSSGEVAPATDAPDVLVFPDFGGFEISFGETAAPGDGQGDDDNGHGEPDFGGGELNFPDAVITSCSPNPCTDPPPRCADNVMRDFGGPGACVDTDTAYECTYAPVSEKDCGALGLYCVEDSAACVQCITNSDCSDTQVCDTVGHSCVTVCPADALEENDTEAEPADITGLGTLTDLFVCADDRDFYAFELASDGNIRAVVASTFTGGGFELTLLDPAGDVVAEGAFDGTDWTLLGTELVAGTYLLAVTTPISNLVHPYSLTVTAEIVDACTPNPCTSPKPATCIGNELVGFAAVGTCTVVGDAPSCDYPPQPAVDCSPGVCFDAKCSAFGPPGPGDLVITEIMITPEAGLFVEDGQWFEVQNVGAKTVTLEGVTIDVENAAGSTTAEVSGALFVSSGNVLIFGPNVDPKQNGGVAVGYPLADAPTFETDFGVITVRNADGAVLDEVAWDDTWSHAAGASLSLQPDAVDTAENDSADSWCTPSLAFGSGGLGSPGKVNGPCLLAIGRCVLEAPLGGQAEVTLGTDAGFGAHLFVAGLTDLTAGPDFSPLVRGELGYGAPGTDPASWTTWASLSPALVALPDPTTDGFQTTIAPDTGVWEVAARFTGDAGASWTLCDLDKGPGKRGSEDGYLGADAATLTVIADACNPNPCVAPVGACVDGKLRLYQDEPGSCIVSNGAVQCLFSIATEEDCVGGGLLCDADALQCVTCGSDEECDAPFGYCSGEGRCVAVCQDDGGEDDDSFALARPAVIGPVDAGRVICQADPDVVFLQLKAGDTVTITANVVKGASILVDAAPEAAGSVAVFGVGKAPITQTFTVPDGPAGAWFITVSSTEQSQYNIAISLENDPCKPDPCAGEHVSCEGKDRVTRVGGQCSVDPGLPGGVDCHVTETARATCPLFCTNGACTDWRLPVAGDLVIAEVAPLEQWIELVPTTSDVLSLDGLQVAGTNFLMTCSTGGVSDAPRISLRTGAWSVDQGPSVACTATGTLPLAGTLTLSRGGIVIDSATYDAVGAAGSVGLDPNRESKADQNDEASAFCPQRALYNGDRIGTPGAANDVCPFAIGFCRVQHPAGLTLYAGESAAIYGRVFVAGVTDQSTGNDPHELLVAQAGIGPDGSQPGTWGLWLPMTPTPGFDGQTAPPKPEPHNDEYTLTTTLPLSPGRYDAAVRFSGDGGSTWTYCDLGSEAPANDGSADGYQPGRSVDVEIKACSVDALEPNSASSPLTMGESGLATILVCGNDEDGLLVTVPAGSIGTLAASFTGASLVVAVRAANVQIGSLADATGSDSLLLAAGTYLLVATAGPASTEIQVSLTLSDDPCLPNPCQGLAAACDGASRVTTQNPGVCSLPGAQAECQYQTTSQACEFGCSAGSCNTPRLLTYEDVQVSEAFVGGALGDNGAWVEVTCLADEAVSFEGALLVGTDAVWTIGGGIYCRPGDVLVFGAWDDPELNGGISVDAMWDTAFNIGSSVGVQDTGGFVTQKLVINGDVVPPEGSMIVSGDAVGPDAPWPNRGTCGTQTPTPGTANPNCPLEIGWCRLQHPPSVDAYPGDSVTGYVRVWVPGVTGDTLGIDAHEDISVEFGYGVDGSYPSGSTDTGPWTWTTATANSGWNAGTALPFPEPYNDEYAGTFSAPAAGLYDYAFRVSGNGGSSWLYCDQSTGEGHDGAQDGYQPENAGDLSVTPRPAPFFSEYIKGASNNKALEIYNPTPDPFDFAGCRIQLGTNGDPLNAGVLLSGIVQSGGTLVACHTSAEAAILAVCAVKSGSINFTGNDSVALQCPLSDGSKIVFDVIGQVEDNPPTGAWTANGISTNGMTLLRDCSTKYGDPIGDDPFDPSVQWTGQPATYTADLGTFGCSQ